jgi:hypothetical protein
MWYCAPVMGALNGNGNGNGKDLFSVGNLISVVAAAGMVAGAYASMSREMGDNRRAIDDLYRVVYEFKKDTQDWEIREGSYDSEIRQKIDKLSLRLTEAIAKFAAYPPPRNGP